MMMISHKSRTLGPFFFFMFVGWCVGGPGRRGRQDVGDVGEGGEGLAEVGVQVGQIVNGVVTGNVGDIFAGTLPFIDDADTQTGIGTIFESLTQPLNNLWASGTKQGLKYFGITPSTSPNPLKGANGTALASSPAPITTTEPSSTDEDEDNEARR